MGEFTSREYSPVQLQLGPEEDPLRNGKFRHNCKDVTYGYLDF